jgi:hypothetical protein
MSSILIAFESTRIGVESQFASLAAHGLSFGWLVAALLEHSDGQLRRFVRR